MSKFFTAMKRAGKEFSEDDLMTYSAAVAYQVFFSLFPFIIFLIALLGFLQLQSVFDFLLKQSKAVMPGSAQSMIENVVSQVQSQSSGGIMSAGVIIALWSASGGVRMLMHAMNVAYDVEDRPAWKKFPLSVLYALLLAVLLIASATLLFMGPQLINPIVSAVGLGSIFTTVWTYARIPIAVVLLIFSVALMYWLFPNYKQPFRFITPGAIIAVIVWILASLAFSFYVANFSSYSATYGALASVIVLLLYFFITALILLFGAEINAETYRVIGQDDGSEEGESSEPGSQEQQSESKANG
ncbi:MAG: YihY/virulence factor BrkB family protein [Rubrobacteraceae bacterium]